MYNVRDIIKIIVGKKMLNLKAAILKCIFFLNTEMVEKTKRDYLFTLKLQTSYALALPPSPSVQRRLPCTRSGSSHFFLFCRLFLNCQVIFLVSLWRITFLTLRPSYWQSSDALWLFFGKWECLRAMMFKTYCSKSYLLQLKWQWNKVRAMNTLNIFTWIRSLRKIKSLTTRNRILWVCLPFKRCIFGTCVIDFYQT